MVTGRRGPDVRDGGGVLVLTLILTVVMAVIVVALASYVTVGLKTSGVATERTDTNADSSSVMSWAIEQFAKKQLRPDDDCGDAPTYDPIVVPGGLVVNGSSPTLVCAQTEPINGEPVVHLVATSVGAQTRIVEATVEIPRYTHGARVADWRVDIPIEVPAYVTTTTTPSATTTTVAGPNTAPSAFDMSVWVNLDDAPFTFELPAVDPDGDLLSVESLTFGTELDVIDGGGLDVSVAALSTGGAVAGITYSFTYTVSHPGPSVSNIGTVTVVVNATSSPPSTSTSTTTTSTLAPAPSCTFEVTSNTNGGNSGIGTLTVSNSGGEFTGWAVRINQPSTSRPWQFNSWDVAVTETVDDGSVVEVTGGQTIPSSDAFSVTVNLVQTGGNPKIQAGDFLMCNVLSP